MFSKFHKITAFFIIPVQPIEYNSLHILSSYYSHHEHKFDVGPKTLCCV